LGPSKRVQLALIGSIGALFFVAALAADRGVSPAVLGGACVAALLVIFLVVRRAGSQAGATKQRRPGSRLRTVAVLAGLGLLEVTQLPSASVAVKTASVAAGIALFIWAVVSSRRSLR
jgi:hypothetical protein